MAYFFNVKHSHEEFVAITFIPKDLWLLLGSPPAQGGLVYFHCDSTIKRGQYNYSHCFHCTRTAENNISDGDYWDNRLEHITNSAKRSQHLHFLVTAARGRSRFTAELHPAAVLSWLISLLQQAGAQRRKEEERGGEKTKAGRPKHSCSNREIRCDWNVRALFWRYLDKVTSWWYDELNEGYFTFCRKLCRNP